MKKYNTVRERLQHIEHAIYGNGSIGLVEQIKEIRADIKSIKRQFIGIIFLLLLAIGEKAIEFLLKIL